MLGLGTGELIIIFVIVLILFGGKRLPEIGRGLGEGIRNFKKGYQEASENGEIKDKKENKIT